MTIQNIGSNYIDHVINGLESFKQTALGKIYAAFQVVTKTSTRKVLAYLGKVQIFGQRSVLSMTKEL